jgi:hypothetical protein
MTWTISHGRPNPGGAFDGYHSRSYSQVAQWREAIVRVPMSGPYRSILEPITMERSGDPFEMSPGRAAAIAMVLRSIHNQVPRGQRELTEALAAAAERASAAGQPWRWS